MKDVYTGDESKKFVLNNDSHMVGSAICLVGFTKYYKALSGCILNLKASLGSEWDKTVVHVHGDFNRNPQNEGGGTDHGPGGQTHLFFLG